VGQRAERSPQPHNQIIPDGKFQGNSSYTDAYTPSKVERQKQFRHEGELKIGGEFKGESSYVKDFNNKGSGIKAERVPLPKNQILPNGKFEGDSVYASNYLPSKTDRQ
jgi:hypothetical protein